MLAEILAEIKGLLQASLPELESSLNEPASESELERFEKNTGQVLPQEFKDLYRLHNGESEYVGLFFGLPFLSLNEAYAEWMMLSRVAENNESHDSVVASYPMGWIKEVYASKSYIPLSKDFGGNYIGIDLDPDMQGTKGQVISFGRDENDRYVIAASLSDFLKFIRFHISNGNYRVDEPEAGEKNLLLKEPENNHFLDTLKDLSLPFDPAKQSEILSSTEPPFDEWYESLNQDWKQIIADNCKGTVGFASLSAIRKLILLRYQLKDITPLEKFTGLTELILSGNPVRDISPLKNSKHLRKLYLAKTKVKNLTTLENLSNLQSLSLYKLPISDISPILGLKKLKSLGVEETHISNLQAIATIKSLTELDVSNNTIDSFDCLKNLTNLTELNLSDTNVTDLSFLTSLKRLHRIDIGGTKVSDFTPLSRLEKLSSITCSFEDFLQIKDMIPGKVGFAIRGHLSKTQSKIYEDYVFKK